MATRAREMRKREGTKFWDEYEKEPEKQKTLEDWENDTKN
jgi:hypothetical protein